MAKRPEQSLDVLGQSLLSQQATRREKQEKRRRRTEKKMMMLGALVAGQSLVNSALKRRTKEIADLGEMSKYKSEIQAKNLSLYGPIMHSMEGHKDAAAWKAHMAANPGEFRAFKGKIRPHITKLTKDFIPGESEDPEVFARVRRYFENDIAYFLIENGMGIHPESGIPLRELFGSGATEFAKNSGVDPTNREAVSNLLTNTTKNSIDAYKAIEINKRNSNLDTSIFSPEVLKNVAGAATLNLIKTEKGESSPFKKISSNQHLLPVEFQQVSDVYDINGLIKERFTSNYAIMKDEVEAFRNNKPANDSMKEVWNNMVERVKQGTWFDVGERREGSGHRLTLYAEDEIDNVFRFVEARLAIKDELLTQAGTLATLMGDPSRPKMKEDVMNIWLEMPHIKKLGIVKGDDEYRQQFSKLDSLIGRQQFTIDFVRDLSIRDKNIIGYEVDFSEVKSITEQKFKIVQDEQSPYQGKVFGKSGKLKFETTKIYNSMNIEEKKTAYKTYLNAIIENQTRSNNTPLQLREVALKFITDIPHPSGKRPEEILKEILEPERLPPRAIYNPYDPTTPITLLPRRLENQYSPHIERMTTLKIIPPNIDNSIVGEKVSKLISFNSFAESRDRNDQVSSVGNTGYHQFKTNDPNNPHIQESLETIYNRFKRNTDTIKDFEMPADLVQMAKNGFVSLENVSKESQDILALSNYIEDYAVDIETGKRLPDGTGSGYMTAYLEAAPGSLEEKQALQNLYFNVQHKSKKGITGKDLQIIKDNFETSYNKIFK